METPRENLGVDRKRTPTKTAAPNLLDYGRIPPQAIDLEQAVLGAMMLEKNAVNDTIDKLQDKSFYDPKHVAIFKAIKELFGGSQPIDLLTVTNRLKQNGELELAGGPFYVAQLTQRIGTTGHIEFHARIIAEKFIQREIIRMCSETLRVAFDETTDVFELLGNTEKDLFAIAESNMRKDYDKMGPTVAKALEEIEKARMQGGGISGVATGFTALDKVTAGWQNSDMIVIAARPAMGKTAFVLSMARNMAVDFNQGVALFSLEMSSVQLVKRLISSETGISGEKLRKGDLADHEWVQLNQRVQRLAAAPIYIDDTPGISIFDLRAKCRRLKMQHDIKIVVIDYLQLMTAGGGKGVGNREQEISSISRSIKEVAKELNIPVIALSQLSRSVETRGGDKKPQLSDLRESGAIEQDADIVSFIYRPEYYGFMENPETGASNEGVGTIIIAKHRNGALDEVNLRFAKQFARFENLEFNGGMDSYPENPSPSPTLGGGMQPNLGFDKARPDILTVKSKGWTDAADDVDFTSNDEAPF
jgi:replicative DNA helicase